MMVENDDLGLSLSLGCPRTTTTFSRSLHHPHGQPLKLNLMSSLLAPSSISPFLPNRPFTSVVPPKSLWIPSVGSSDRTSVGAAMAAVEKGMDVNRSGGEEDEAGVSSPMSTISSISGKRSERASSRGGNGISDEEDGETSCKKLRLSKQQSALLEESFKEHSTLNPKQKVALANRLGLRTRQVEVWFQNRRARTKLKQTEVECDLLRRCCEELTEKNKRLQKEVEELRALKMSPQFYMQMKPPTTLTMCPSCERVGRS